MENMSALFLVDNRVAFLVDFVECTSRGVHRNIRILEGVSHVGIVCDQRHLGGPDFF